MNDIPTFIKVIWVAGIAVTIAFWGFVVWAVWTLVNHAT